MEPMMIKGIAAVDSLKPELKQPGEA